jgi:hypothetical protein
MMTSELYFSISIIFAMIIAVAGLIAFIVGAVQIFQRYISTGRAKSENDAWIKFVSNDKFLYYRRGTGFESLISGLLVDSLATAVIFLTWPVTVPLLVLTLTAVYMRVKRVAKENFIDSLKGTRRHTHE